MRKEIEFQRKILTDEDYLFMAPIAKQLLLDHSCDNCWYYSLIEYPMTENGLIKHCPNRTCTPAYNVCENWKKYGFTR